MSHVSIVSAGEFCDGHGRAVPALGGGALTGGAAAGMAGLLGSPGDPRLEALLPFAVVFLGLLGVALVLGSLLRLSPRALGGVGLTAWLLVALAAAPLAWTGPVGGDLATAAAAERRILLRTATSIEVGLDRLTGGAGMAGLAARCSGTAGPPGGDGASTGDGAATQGFPNGPAWLGLPAKQTTASSAGAASALGFSFIGSTVASPPTVPAMAAAAAQPAAAPTGDAAGDTADGSGSDGDPAGDGSANGTGPTPEVCAALEVIERLSGIDLTTAEGQALDDLGDALRVIVGLATGDPSLAGMAAGARDLLADLGRLSAALGDRSLADALDRAAGTTGTATGAASAAGPATAGEVDPGSIAVVGSAGGSGATTATGSPQASGNGGGIPAWSDLLAGLAPFLLAAALALFAARAAAVMLGWVRAPTWPYPEAASP